MELWIRSQHKGALIKSSGLYFKEECREFANGDKTKWVICEYSGDEIVGCYKTMERCVEILDEIQKLIVDSDKTLLTTASFLDKETFDDILKEVEKNNFTILSCVDTPQVFPLNQTVVYQMPEK